MNQNKKSLFELSRRSPVASGFILIFTAIVYPSWYFALQWFDPGVQESLGLRLLVGVLALCGFLLLKIKRINEKYRNLISYGLIFIVLIHYHYILITNNLRESLVSADTLLIACIGIIPTQKRWNLSVLAWIISLSLITAYLSEASVQEKIYFLVSVFTIVTMVSIVQLDRISTLSMFSTMEARQRTVINNLSEGILLYLQSGKIEFYNSVAQRIFGFSVPSTSYSDIAPYFIDENEEPITQNFFHQCLLEAKDREGLVVGVQGRNHRIKWIQLNLIPLCLDPNNPVQANAVLASLTDITEEREAKKTIETHQIAMIQNAKMAALGEMASGVAHEITNPLAIIQLLTKQISREAKQENINGELMVNACGKMSFTVQRIAKIIQGLRTYSRNDQADKMEIHSAFSIIEDTLSFCGEACKNGEIELQINKPDFDLQVLGHKAQLSQVLLNLLHNAKDAIENCPIKRISVNLSFDSDDVFFAVEDSGPGVPQEIRAKIMETFFTTKAAGKGTGLGLSISRSIAEKHGGSLYLDETPGGNRFVLKLPRQTTQGDRKAS